MKITDIRTILLRTPLEEPTRLPVGTWVDHRNLIVLVETDTGVRGSGEIWINFPTWGGDDRVFVVGEVLKPLLVGETIDQPTRLFARMQSATSALARRWHAPGPVSHAIAGVDIAIWDAFAQNAKQTLRAAISENPADQVDVYASSFGPGSVADAITTSISQGHTRLKLRLVDGVHADERTLREARETAGDLTLMADPAETYDLRGLGAIWEAVLESDLCWLEEPFASDDREAYAEFHGWEGRPSLALGESSYGLSGMRTLLETFRPEIVQPDLTKTGGISQGLQIAKHVIGSGKQFVPHMLGGPIGFMASANLVAALDGASLVEMDHRIHPSFEAIYGGYPSIVSGSIELTDAYGHGAAIDESRLRQWMA